MLNISPFRPKLEKTFVIFEISTLKFIKMNFNYYSEFWCMIHIFGGFTGQIFEGAGRACMHCLPHCKPWMRRNSSLATENIDSFEFLFTL